MRKDLVASLSFFRFRIILMPPSDVLVTKIGEKQFW